MAITDKEKGVWGLDQVYNKINQGSIWAYSSNLKNLWGWGDNGRGQLGQNNETEYSSPVQVGSDATWETLSKASGSEAGWIYARKNDSTLWAIGRNNYGILGQNEPSNSHRSSPVQIPGNYDGNILSSGNRHTLFSKTEGTLYGVGSNQYGGLGQNSRTSPPSGISSPVQIPGTNWSQAVGGYLASFALKSDGTYWAWGNNAYGYGQLGQTQGSQNFSSPVQVPGSWSKIPHSIGGAKTAGIRTDGTLWVWGQGGAYLNKNVSTPYSSPIQIPGTTWKTVSCGLYGTQAIKTDNTFNLNTPPIQKEKYSSKQSPYVIQIGAFSSLKNANRLKLQANQIGYKVEIVQVDTKDRTLNAVRVVRYNSKTTAEKAGQNIKRKLGVDYRVLYRPING